jgi:hypothetical protein
MPLGPVPFGFMNLTEYCPDIVSNTVPSGLSYNSIEYSIKQRLFERKSKNNSLYQAVDIILSALRNVKTSELVEISHKEPSWVNNPNGTVFNISDKDLANPIPAHSKVARLDTDDQLIQASLVKGMIDDIVSESTDLEYSDNDEM